MSWRAARRFDEEEEVPVSMLEFFSNPASAALDLGRFGVPDFKLQHRSSRFEQGILDMDIKLINRCGLAGGLGNITAISAISAVARHDVMPMRPWPRGKESSPTLHFVPYGTLDFTVTLCSYPFCSPRAFRVKLRSKHKTVKMSFKVMKPSWSRDHHRAWRRGPEMAICPFPWTPLAAAQRPDAKVLSLEFPEILTSIKLAADWHHS
jgi:hypothetical protein